MEHPAPVAAPDESAARLVRLARLAVAAGAPEIAADADALAARLAEGRFYVACLGQFKRGKSTLINALVGDAVLPAGVVPVTSVVTVVRHGPARAARVRLAGGEWRAIDPATLGEFVAEEGNHANAKHVEAVEVFEPSPLLELGMCLVDTPGLGSVFAEASEATRTFVPHVDAAIVVIGADPPITAQELDLIEAVAKQVSRVIVVLNKADRLSDIDREQAARFAERVIAERLHRSCAPIWQISAAERLSGRGPARDWPGFAAELQTLAHQSGASLVRDAERRGVRLLSARLRRDLDQQQGALTRPLVETERQVDELRQAVAEAERSLADLSFLFTAEEQRFERRLGEAHAQFLHDATPAASAELRAELARLHERGPAYRRRAFELAMEVAERTLEPWRRAQYEEAEALYRQLAARFVELANAHIARLAGVPGLDFLPPERGLRVRSGFFPTRLYRHAASGPGRWLLDSVGPTTRRTRAVERDAVAYLTELLDVNARRVHNDFIDRVRESRRGLEGEIRARLRQVMERAGHALDQARAAQRGGAAVVARWLDKIASYRASIDALEETPPEGDGP